MEILKSVMTDYVLFSLIDSYIFCLFFKNMGKCSNIKWYECMMLGLVNSIVSTFGIPIIYQLVGILYMGIFISLKEKRNIKDSLFLSLSASVYILTVEATYSLFVNVVFNMDTSHFDDVKLFMMIIPMRIIEITILKRGDTIMKNMKWWFGDVEKPEKEEVKTESK